MLAFISGVKAARNNDYSALIDKILQREEVDRAEQLVEEKERDLVKNFGFKPENNKERFSYGDVPVSGFGASIDLPKFETKRKPGRPKKRKPGRPKKGS